MIGRRWHGRVRGKYYDFDPDYQLELEPQVLHFEVIAASG
jgi:hypothetical protein